MSQEKKSLTFPDQHENEEVFFVLRRHWIAFLPKVILAFFMNILPPIVFFLVARELGITYDPQNIITVLAILIGSLYYFFIWLIFYHDWLDYYLDVWIVTSERLLDINQKGLFSRVVSELSLHNVQDVTSETHGFIPTFLKYGDVHVQSAGTLKTILFDEVSDPSTVAREIMRLSKKAHKPNHTTKQTVENPSSEELHSPEKDNEIDFTDHA